MLEKARVWEAECFGGRKAPQHQIVPNYHKIKSAKKTIHVQNRMLFTRWCMAAVSGRVAAVTRGGYMAVT